MSKQFEFKTAILGYLEEKYQLEFSIDSLYKMFDGQNGSYVRAVCTDGKEEGTFDVFVYMVGKNEGLPIKIDDNEYVISDKYPEIVFQRQLQEMIEARIDQDVFVRCEVLFANYSLSAAEYERGMAACLNDAEISSHVSVYIVADEGVDMSIIRESVEAISQDYDAYRQYLYFATAPGMPREAILQEYEDNTRTYAAHLIRSELISRVEFTLLRRGEGICKRSVERG